jgi:hypothetical protein
MGAKCRRTGAGNATVRSLSRDTPELLLACGAAAAVGGAFHAVHWAQMLVAWL